MDFVFIDHTDFRSSKDVTPDIFLMGAVVLSIDNLNQLTDIISGIVGKYTVETLPIKWNFKDQSIRKTHLSFGRENEYKKMLHESYEWRKQIFNEADDLNYRVILSAVENFQKQDKKVKPDLIKYAFSNLLMRVGLYLKSRKSTPSLVVIDWPDKGDKKPYENEYFYAFNRGRSSDKIEYFAGKLKDLNFIQSVVFANSNHSVGLQFVDLIIGAFASGFNAFKNDHLEDIGITVSDKILNKIYRTNKGVLGSGICISKNNPELKEEMQKYLEYLNLPF